MAAHSSILAWRIPRTEEPEGLQSTGSQSQARLTLTHTHTHITLQSHQTQKTAGFVCHSSLSPAATLFLVEEGLCWVSLAAHRLSLVGASGGSSSLQFAGFLSQWLLLLQNMGSRAQAQ